MTDVQQARIEAAARAMWERSPREGDPTWADLDYGIKEIWRKDAAAALQAADAVVTVDMIAAALHGDQCPEDPDPGELCGCDGDYFYRMAEVAQRLYQGGEHHND